ncbi:MAG: hypothetical protein ACYCV7_06120 [Acidimicrobiales bacterium]
MHPSAIVTPERSDHAPDGETGAVAPRHRIRSHLRDPVPWLVGIAALGMRVATAAQGPTDWDSAQYASAVNRFDVTHGLPQPPGYWLYIEAGRAVKAMTGLSGVHALVAVAAVASAVGAGLAVVAGRELGGRWMGAATGAIVATSPFVWFDGSIVATYSFDMLACSLMIILAWRARPGTWHGVCATGALGLLAGFRQSIIEAFALLAIVAVVASTRRWGRLVVTSAVGVASVAVWWIPMVLQQPGGASVWLRATRLEITGAEQVTSIFDTVSGGRLNLGTFAAYTVVALAPLAAAAVVAAVVLAARSAVRRWREGIDAPEVPGCAGSAGCAVPRSRPWFQAKGAILAAAIIPPVAIVALVQFATGGYLLAYLPASVIALLLPLAALNRRIGRDGPPRRSPVWSALTSLAVVAIVVLGAQRFLSGNGVLPARWLRPTTGGVWLQQARYQAPYLDTRAAIVRADAVDSALAGLGALVDPNRDVIVFDTLDGGANIYRNAGYALADIPIALIEPGHVLYNQFHHVLYYARGSSVAAAPSGSVYLVASPALPGLASLVTRGYALPVATPQPIGGYRVWRIHPGTSILGVSLVSLRGPRPLGRGI